MWLLLVVSAAGPAQIYLQYSRVLCGSLCPSSPTIYSPDSSKREREEWTVEKSPGAAAVWQELCRICNRHHSWEICYVICGRSVESEDGCFFEKSRGKWTDKRQQIFQLKFQFSVTNHTNHKWSQCPINTQIVTEASREVSAAPNKLSRNNEHVKETECWKMRTCLGPNLNLNWDADLIQTKKYEK